jgi:hypothetical protein
METVALATEDELSEAVGLRLLWEASLEAGLLFRRGGNGYLRSRLDSFCEIARRQPLLIITDLDRSVCPAALRSAWFGRLSPPKGLLLRVAVREIESWLFADHDAMQSLLGNAVAARFPDRPEGVENPKELLLALAARAPRDVRADLCAVSGAFARQGLGYNARLCMFVREMWNPDKAEARSESLRRARKRILELRTMLGNNAE